MIPRGKPDIGFGTLLKGIRYSLSDLCFPKASRKTIPVTAGLHCLSVRTALDLCLRALNFPPGTAILVTDINIPDMFNIIAAHGLEAIPIPIHKHSLEIDTAELLTENRKEVKALLVTHLFGALMPTEKLIDIARKKDWLVIEDRAQAFYGDHQAPVKADIVLYSFGLIKTHTAISGALLKIADPLLMDQVKLLHSELPLQRTSVYLQKLFKSFCIRLLVNKWLYTLFYQMIVSSGKDFDEVLSGFTRGFPGKDPLLKIRYRITPANSRLISSRLDNFDIEGIHGRKKLAGAILENIPDHMRIGHLNAMHTYWVLPVESRNPAGLIGYLRRHGFDATAKASSLVRLSVFTQQFSENSLSLENLVYLPMYVDMSRKKRVELAALITNFEMSTAHPVSPA